MRRLPLARAFRQGHWGIPGGNTWLVALVFEVLLHLTFSNLLA